MDFLERFFGCSPDGGGGSAEVFLLLAVVFAIAGVALRLAMKHKPEVGIWPAASRRSESGT